MLKYSIDSIQMIGDENMNINDARTENKKLSIIKADGTTEEVEQLVCFLFNDTKKEYVVYTKNEKDENGNITIYVSSVDRSGDLPKMGAIESDEEWSKIKDVLRELSKNDQEGERNGFQHYKKKY